MATISVIITTYNRKNYLIQAIEGICTQKMNDFEIIVVDDCSTDDTEASLKKYIGSHPNFKIEYIKNNKNLGPSESRKKGYSASTGKYIIFSDDDDFYTNNLFFTKIVEIFKKHPDLSFVSANVGIFYETENKIDRESINICGYIDGQRYLNAFQYEFKKPVSTFSTAFNRAKLEESQIKNIKMMNDSSIYLYALLCGDAYIMQDFVGRYRVHEQNITKSLDLKFLLENMEEKEIVLEKAILKKRILDPKKWWANQMLLTLRYYILNNSITTTQCREIKKWCEEHGKKYSVNIISQINAIQESKKTNKKNNPFVYITKKTEPIIKKTILMKYKKIILLRAYLEENNLGDDLFVIHLCKKYPDVLFVYFDHKTHPAFEKIKNLHNCSTNKIINNNINMINLVKRLCDATVYIGGSIFIEPANLNAFFNTRNGMLMKNKPFYIISSNFGPYTSNEFLEKNKKWMSNVTNICFRDKYSYNLFQNMINVQYAPDALFDYPMPNRKEYQNKICICTFNVLRNHDTYDSDITTILNKLEELISHYINLKKEIVLIAFCPGQGDSAINDLIYNAIKSQHKKYVKNIKYNGNNLNQIIDTIVNSEYVIAMRFHAMIFGMTSRIPIYPIIYSNKQLNVLKDIEFEGKFTTISDLKNKSPEEIDYNRTHGYVINCNQLIEESKKQFSELDYFIKPINRKKEKKPMFSIITPAYNCEKYIYACIKSVLVQEEVCFEMIIIDDGSTDNTKKIIQKMMKTDMRITYHYQENKGAYSARNKGIELASGEYIIFLDSDDLLSENALKMYKDMILEYDPDMIISSAYSFNNDTYNKNNAKWVLKEENTYGKEILEGSILNDVRYNISCSAPWSKCYKKTLISKNYIKFAPLPRAEDVCFVQLALHYSKKICVLKYETTYYRSNTPGSLENFMFEKHPCAAWESSKISRNIIKKDSEYILSKKSLDNADADRLMWIIKSIKTEKALKELYVLIIREVMHELFISTREEMQKYYSNKEFVDVLLFAKKADFQSFKEYINSIKSNT